MATKGKLGIGYSSVEKRRSHEWGKTRGRDVGTEKRGKIRIVGKNLVLRSLINHHYRC